MNINKKYRLTKEGLEKNKERLRHLEEVERPQNIIDLQEARAQGDLSENADYDAARDEQARIVSEINHLKDIINNAEIIDESELNSGVVDLGNKVKIKFLDNNEVAEYMLLSSLEADPRKGTISTDCPVGNAIVNKEIGDIVRVKSETGIEFEVEVLEIS